MSIHPVMQRLAEKLKREHPLPEFRPRRPDSRQVKIKEGDKERLQAFEGLVIAINKGPQGTFTVRKMSFGQGVERIFPFNSKLSTKSRRFAATRCAAPSSSTSASCAARPPVSRKWAAPPPRHKRCRFFSAPFFVHQQPRLRPGLFFTTVFSHQFFSCQPVRISAQRAFLIPAWKNSIPHGLFSWFTDHCPLNH